ncbi:hypothetical protein V1L54_19615 [Streptomyces sp. TRM 70361]|uniref:hypothetical protein n=1 Tax=Streptomyces sp. TRM 70361 TaxID=3116553 RepID=UPI002E7B9761|nr:hypothetical protein [Streptomyces sp. TRM 70361]MEE1941590.1 hypothetical protein [Streptomyces sp. TRM 70361]
MTDDRPAAPPVRLPAEAALARDALASPLLSRAAGLARWAGGRTEAVRAGAGGGPPAGLPAEAAAPFGPGEADDGDGPLRAARVWELAVGTGLLELRADGGDGAARTAVPGARYALLTGGSPAEALEIWYEGLETVLAARQPDRDGDGLLDSALDTLYRMAARDSGGSAGETGPMVPLPVLAASAVAPDDMDDPTDTVLERVSAAMVALDEGFRTLAPTGAVVHRPVDGALFEEDGGVSGGSAEEPGGPAGEEVARYGMVRLTPLGLYGVRRRLLAAGVPAPVVGDLAGHAAGDLLAALPGHGEEAARGEIEHWLARRAPLEAARELLAAARGDDRDAPRRRLACQQALSLAGAEAEPALREVLDDGQLGGLARVWLSERGLADVPAPSEEMVFWLTVDTLAAQLATADDAAGAGGSDELRDLVRGLVDGHSGFFDKAWRVDHPATGEVLEAMSRVHPDRQAAKDARRAAYRARSRG